MESPADAAHSDRRAMIAVWATSSTATAAIMAPLWRPGYLLYRDAVSTPRTFVTDTTLGIGGNPPRAVPQDGLIALLSTVVDGGVVVVVVLTLSLLLAGVGYGLLARRIVPASGAAGASAAAILGVWNPFVAERLLQGHWSLFTAYASLGWILLSALRIRESGTRDEPASAGASHSMRSTWATLLLATLVAALTPSGWLIAALTLVAALMIPLLLRRRWRAGALCATPIVVGMSPWLTATIVGSAATTVHAISVPTFALRAEPGLGRVLTAVSLGGIWNADAVPASRQSGWAAVASILFIVVMAVGIWLLWRTRNVADQASRAIVNTAAGLAGAAMIAVLVASSGPGMSVLKWLTSSVGGAGLLRDTTKFSMLAVPLAALAAAAVVGLLRQWVPAGFAFCAAALLIVAPLPDLGWGAGGRIAPVTYPDEWRAVTARVAADDGAVALWPGDTVRRFDFTRGPSLDPTARMVAAPVAESGELVVDRVVIDQGSRWATEIHRALSDGGDLRALGVGWVLASAPVPGFERMTPVCRGPTLTLYRIDGPRDDFAASTTARVAALTALGLWLTAIVGALAALLISVVARRRR